MVASAVVLLFLAATTAQGGWLFVVAAGLLGVLAASALLPHRLSHCDAGRIVPRLVAVGDTVRVRVELRNRGRRPVPLVLVEDRFPAFVGWSKVVPEVPPAGARAAEPRVRAHRRGAHVSGPVELTCEWPFGLMRSRRALEVGSPVVVTPRVVRLRSLPLSLSTALERGELEVPTRVEAGNEFVGVREYRPGDPARSVHWRSSARAGTLVARELHDEARGKLSCVVAGRDDGEPPESSFEALLSAAASICAHALERGHPVQLARAGAGGEPDVLAAASRAQMLEWLAHARPGEAALDSLVSPVLAGERGGGAVAILVPSAGRTPAGLPSAVRTVAASGRAALVVVALSETWMGRPEARHAALGGAFGGRAAVRTISRGRDLRACLEA